MITRKSYSQLYTKEDLTDHDGVAVVIRDERGWILMQKHIKYDVWTIPGGKVDPDDTLVDTVEKEMFEETGLYITECIQIKDKAFVYIKNDVTVNMHMYIFEALAYHGTMENREPHKHSAQMFVEMVDIAFNDNLSDATKLWMGFLDKEGVE